MIFCSTKTRDDLRKPLLPQLEKEQNCFRGKSEAVGNLGFGDELKLHSHRRDFLTVVLLVSKKGQIVTGPAKSTSNGRHRK